MKKAMMLVLIVAVVLLIAANIFEMRRVTAAERKTAVAKERITLMRVEVLTLGKGLLDVTQSARKNPEARGMGALLVSTMEGTPSF